MDKYTPTMEDAISGISGYLIESHGYSGVEAEEVASKWFAAHDRGVWHQGASAAWSGHSVCTFPTNPYRENGATE